MWWTKAVLALFGCFTIPASFLVGWVLLLFPESKPDIDTIDEISWEEKPISSMWMMMVSCLSMLSTSGMFMFTQLFTWGESDLRDFAIIYMDSTEAFLYMMLNTFWQSMMFVPAMMWFSMTFWIYGLQMMMKCAMKFMKMMGWDDMWKEGKHGKGDRDHDDKWDHKEKDWDNMSEEDKMEQIGRAHV